MASVDSEALPSLPPVMHELGHDDLHKLVLAFQQELFRPEGSPDLKEDIGS